MTRSRRGSERVMRLAGNEPATPIGAQTGVGVAGPEGVDLYFGQADVAQHVIGEAVKDETPSTQQPPLGVAVSR